jgi:hypothetical protein
MTGYSYVLKIRDIEQELEKLGLMMSYPRNSYSSDVQVAQVAIKPRDLDSLPIYARDAELFQGTIEELEVWLRGVQWARKYDRMIFGKNHDTNREKKEQNHRNENLILMIRTAGTESVDAANSK